jgi:glucose-6-phosphate dehydrogenase assembly protein OpcA
VENAVTAGVVATGPEVVSVAAVERYFARPWQLPAVADIERPSRALMGNLVIVCRTDEAAAEIASELPVVVAQYPARVLLLVADAAGEGTTLGASVTIYRRARGGVEHICGESVTLHAAGDHLIDRLASVVRALLLGDLPVTLWWATAEAPPLAGELFTQLAALADQVVYDSYAWPDPLRQLIVTATRIASGRVATADLAWRRPKLWRRIIAQSLDPVVAPGALDAIEEIHLDHGPHALTQAWLLVGWLALRLGWTTRGGKVLPGPEVSWSFQSAHGTPRVEIRRLADRDADLHEIRIVTRVNTRRVTLRFTRQGPGRISMLADGLSDRMLWVTGPVPSRGELVARQLPDLERDRLFESSVALARTMAESLL